MNMLWLFITMCVAGGFGGAAGSMIGHAVGRGGLMAGGILGGIACVAGAGILAVRLKWILAAQRVWAVMGGELGFVLAVLVALSTLSSPVGPILSTLLVGAGAVLGVELGKSAHRRQDI